MNALIRTFSIFSLALLLLAGCGGGGNSSGPALGDGGGGGTGGGGGGIGDGGGGGTSGALEVGGEGLSTAEVVDATGSAVTANFSSALAINDLNQIIGYAEVTPGAPFNAAFWTVNASGEAAVAPEALNPLTGNDFSAAFDLDDSGTAVGLSAKGTQRVAVIWPAGADPVELPALNAAGNSAAFAISADGTLVAGEAQDATGRTRPVLWVVDAQGGFSAPVLLPLNLFARGADLSPFGSADDVVRVEAEGILVVGQAEAGDGILHAALWRSADGGASFTAVDLGGRHVAYGVNRAGQVVGENDDTLAPVFWNLDADGAPSSPVSLADAGSAVAVNENGRIAGWSGETGIATVWDGTAPTTLFAGNSRAYALNNEAQPLVVGRNGSQGFVKRVQ